MRKEGQKHFTVVHRAHHMGTRLIAFAVTVINLVLVVEMMIVILDPVMKEEEVLYIIKVITGEMQDRLKWLMVRAEMNLLEMETKM